MAEFSIILGNKNYSSWSFRGWLALKLCGVDFAEEVIPLDLPNTGEDIRRHSPSGRVPMLHHGAVGVWESMAIGEYLADIFPDAGLWPRSLEARAMARSVSAEMHAGFTALRQGMPMNMRASLPGKGMAEGVQADINRVTAIWRGCREHFGEGGAFLFGEFCLADAMYAPVASRFTTYAVALDEVSEAYRQAVTAHPAYVEWLDAARNEPWIIPREEL